MNQSVLTSRKGFLVPLMKARILSMDDSDAQGMSGLGAPPDAASAGFFLVTLLGSQAGRGSARAALAQNAEGTLLL